MPEHKKYSSVNEYFSDFNGETRARLESLRDLIRRIAPESTERISYNIPAAFIGKTIIVYYSGYAHHVSIYPGHIQSEDLDPKLQSYLSGKSTLKFPNNQPLPMNEIEHYITMRASLARG